MGIKGQNAISCRGGLGLHVTRGEQRIQEMENHLKCMRDKLSMLETMLPGSVINSKNQEGEPETDDQEDKCEGCFSNLDGEKADEEQMCVLKSQAIKEKKLREEIFHMECKEKKYLNVLSKVKVNQCSNEETKKLEDDQTDLIRADDPSPRSQRGESGVKEKISQLEEYGKKLCHCLRSIQNNRMEWFQEAKYLSKEFNVFEDNRRLEDFWGFCKPERNEEKGDDCPCGEQAKCNSCTICTCSDWEEDLEIGLKENPKEDKEPKIIEEKKMKKKSNCKCFQSSSDSKSSKSLEINDIYNCSISKMQSEISIATTSIPSTVEDLIVGDEEDKKKFCCLCNPEDDCQKFCEICLCEWEQKDRANQKLYLDDYDRCDSCEICNQERFRGGMDLGVPSEELGKKGFKQSLPSVVNKIPEPENKIKEGNVNGHKDVPSSVGSPQIYKNLEIEELKLNLQLLRVRNNALRKWIQDRNNQINFDPSKDKIIAALLEEIKKSSPNHSKIRSHSHKEKVSNDEMPRKDLAVGLFVLFVTFSSYLFKSNGIFSLSLFFKFLFEIIFFPYRISSQIYRYFKILYGSLNEFILHISEILLNNFKNQKLTENDKFDLQSIFRLISILLITGTLTKFLFSTENVSSNGKLVETRLRIIIRSAVKKIMFLQVLITFVLHHIFTIFSDLVDFFLPKFFSNFFYRVMNSFIATFRILLKRKSSLFSLNFVFIMAGFLINKMWNLSEVKIDLEFLSWFYNQYILCETLEVEKRLNVVDDSISEEFYKPSGFFSFLNVSLQNIFDCGKLIFQTFEIK